jgi:hypothetical protein
LSGGLGSSAYVFQKLDKYFQQERSTRFCVDETRIQMCADPQLVVVKGLLLERKNSILRTRLARASYGIVTEQLYSKKRHFNPHTKLDPHNKKIYATDQIEWLVKRGDRIPAGKIFNITVERRASKEDPRRWTENVVWSENPQNCLPNSMTQRGFLLSTFQSFSSPPSL